VRNDQTASLYAIPEEVSESLSLPGIALVKIMWLSGNLAVVFIGSYNVDPKLSNEFNRKLKKELLIA